MSEYYLNNLDLKGNDDNYLVLKESIPLKYLGGNFFRPDLTPFYTHDFELTDKNGQILKLDVDYKFTDLIPPMMELTGREVYSYIEIINSDVLNRFPVAVTYRSLGIKQIPRAMMNLDELAASNKKKLDFNTDIKGLPETFPVFNHLHNVTNETTGWETLIEAIQQLVAFRTYRSKVFFDELNAITEQHWANINAILETLADILWSHTRNYKNPHNTNKFDILLGNVQNQKTATLNEAVGGVPDTLVTASKSVNVIESINRKSDANYRAGLMPFSFLGNDGYLKPNITGEVTGMGFGSDPTLFVKEANGDVIGLLSRFNGKKRSLTYYKKTTTGITPTVQNYEHPVITNNGNDSVSYLFDGSSPQFAMMSNDAGTKAYLIQMNNTLNPASHAVAKVDLTKIITNVATLNGGVTENAGRWEDYYTLIDGGDYVYLFAKIKDTANGNDINLVQVYRVAKSTILGNATVTFNSFNFTYTPYGGTQAVSTNGRIVLATKTLTNGLVTKYYGNFNPGLSSVNNDRNLRILSGKYDSRSKVAKVQVITQLGLVSGASAKLAYVGVVFDLDETKSTFTPDASYPMPSFNFNTQAPSVLSPNESIYKYLVGDVAGIGVSILKTGEVLVLNVKTGLVYEIDGWGETPFQVAGILPSTTYIKQPKVSSFPVKQYYNNFNYHNPMALSHDQGGYLFQALVNGEVTTWFNNSTLPYVQRLDLPSLSVANTYGPTTDGISYKVESFKHLPRMALIDNSESGVNETVWNPLSIVSLPTKAFDPEDLKDVFTNNRMVKTQKVDSVALIGDGSFTYWSSGIQADLIKWLTNNTTPKSFALEAFFLGDPKMKDTKGAQIDIPLFVNCLYADAQNNVYNVYGVCMAKAVSVASLTVDLPSYRVVSLELGKTIFVDNYLGVNDSDLSVVGKDGKAYDLLLGKMKNTGIGQSDYTLAVTYFDYGFTISKGDGVDYELQINPYPYDVSVVAGLSSRLLVTEHPVLNSYGMVDFKVNSAINGSSLMTVMLNADKTDLSFYLKSGLNVKDAYTQRTLFTYARHIMDVTELTSNGIYGEAYRSIYDDSIDSLTELTGFPGIGELDISGSRKRTGMTGILGVKGSSGYWANAMAYMNNLTVYFSDEVSVNMSGVTYKLAPTTIDIKDQFTDYQNKMFFVYVVINRGVAKYLISPNRFPVNNNLLYIGSLQTGTTSILSTTIIGAFMVNGHMLSTRPRGSAVPATTGLPTSKVNINWY